LVADICLCQPQLLDGFNIEWYTQGWTAPVDLDFDDEGIMYVSEKEGTVWRVRDGLREQEPLIDISDEVANFGDMGLLSITLDNNYKENGYVYLYYAVDRHHWINFNTPNYDSSNNEYWNATFARVTRYQVDKSVTPEIVNPQSRQVLIGKNQLDGIPSLYTSHMGGTVLMGDDGTLLISTGDASTWRAPYGGNGPPYFEEYVEQGIRDQIIKPSEDLGAYRAQYTNNLNGKILRINAETGMGIPSNPYYNIANPNSAQSKVYALGLRNPYIYIGDVGNINWEEINVAKFGGHNFGWPLYEGVGRMAEFYAMDTRHPDHTTSDACGQAKYLFRDLIQQPKLEFPFNVFTDPCDESKMLEERITHVHTLPAMMLGHWAVDGSFYVPVFDSAGDPSTVRIDDEQSPVYGVSRGWQGICSIIGGVDEGETYPEWYKGKLFIGDYDRGWIKVIETDLNDDILGISDFYSDTMQITHIEINPEDGALYFIDFNNGIRKISYGQNIKPVAISSADVTFGPSPLTVSFDASESYDPNDDEISIRWDFGNANISDEKNPTYTFVSENQSPNSQWVCLTVKDEEGLESKDSILISLNNTPPAVSITNIDDNYRYAVDGLTFLDMEAEVSDNEHPNDELTYAWQMFLGHNTHEHPEAIITDKNPRLQLLPTSCGLEDFYYRIDLTITDPQGLSGRDTKILLPDCNNAFVELLNFSLDQLNDAIALSWTTGFEKNLDEIIIERADGQGNEYQSIASIDGTNQGNMRWAYDYKDNEILNGTRLYRLRMISNRGQEVFSQSIEINFVHPETLQITPNPASDMVEVLFGQLVAEGMIVIYDLNGRKVMQQNFPKDGPLLSVISIKGLMSGSYIYTLSNGEQSRSGKLLVNN